jgi:hypothetical protein
MLMWAPMALRTLLSVVTLGAITAGPTLFVGCGSKGETPDERVEGQSEFISAPPNGAGGSRAGGTESAGTSDSAAPAPSGDLGAKVPDARKIEETDLYRLEGDRLYYLNGYRGLMVFDVADITKPRLLGRSPIYGYPVEMIVRGGIANVIVSDWYGASDDGSPFHGSIVRQIDARDPLNIKINGEAKLGGWVRDTRIVGDVMYTVSEDYGWHYGYDYYEGDSVASSTGSKVLVTAVAFGGGTVKQTGRIELPGYGGIFYVNHNSIMLAHDVVKDPSKPWSEPTGKTELIYVDISDPLGTIKQRGKLTVNGRAQGWGADNGRWNVDFADQKFAHVIGCGGTWCGSSGSEFVLATADFTNPDAPTLASEIGIPGTSWTPTARFVEGRMYLSPSNGWYDSSSGKTPIQIFDTSDPKAPKLAGSAEITGNVWLFMPSGNKLFALGNEYSPSGPYYDSSKVSLRYLDVTDPSKPTVIGSSVFGEGWAWTPAAGTFKAFTKDDKQGLVVLPFSGWSSKTYSYNNGLQLIEFNETSIKTAGAAKTKGWVERGIFVKGSLVSLSDTALSVVDYSDRANPKVIKEITLARNVVNAQPQGKTIAQLSSDWYDNDLSKSELRILPITDPEEKQSLDGALASVSIEGYNARVFRNGDLAYVVSDVREKVACPSGAPKGDGPEYGGSGECWSNTQKIQVVDLAGDKAVLKGSVKLPTAPSGYWGWGWYGCYYWDWYNGADVVQVQGDALAFRRWYPVYSADGKYEESKHALYVVDLKDAAAPKIASTAITTDPWGWWGNMRVAGNTLYVSHYDWITKPDPLKPGETKSYVKYFLDQVDLSDRSSPKIGARINVPGIMVGASATDPSLVYTIDYRWYGDTTKDELSVVKIKGDKAYLQGSTLIDGYVGQVFVQGNKAYASAQRYYYEGDTYKGPRVQLHEIDVTDPKAPVDRVSTEKKGWGWLLGVAGDRAVLTSGWGGSGVDIYKLSAGAAPAFDQFVRTRGWWSTSLTRQDNSLFLASGYWGVQKIDLK